MNKNRKNIRDISFMSKKNGRVIMVHSVIAREVARLLENDDRVEHFLSVYCSALFVKRRNRTEEIQWQLLNNLRRCLWQSQPC